jgi:hypothetical protein
MNPLLLQKNIWQEYAYDRFLASLTNENIEFVEVNVVPFTDEFDEPVNFIPHAIFGSGRFVNVCRTKGFPTFKSFDPIDEFYPWVDWVNGVPNRENNVVRFGDLKKTVDGLMSPVFVKPFTEKFFTGLVLHSASDVDKIQLASSFIEDENDELVRVTPAVNIHEEVRFFIVNRTIISASVYKVNGVAKQYRIDGNHPSWKRCASLLRCYGAIDKAFVMDLGRVGYDDWMIVELNNINSSGLYEIDTDAFARSLKYL